MRQNDRCYCIVFVSSLDYILVLNMLVTILCKCPPNLLLVTLWQHHELNPVVQRKTIVNDRTPSERGEVSQKSGVSDGITLYFRTGWLTSWIIFVFTVSMGVTARMASAIPAPIPANMVLVLPIHFISDNLERSQAANSPLRTHVNGIGLSWGEWSWYSVHPMIMGYQFWGLLTWTQIVRMPWIELQPWVWSQVPMYQHHDRSQRCLSL